MHIDFVKIELSFSTLDEKRQFRRKNLLTKAKLLFQFPDGLIKIIIESRQPLLPVCSIERGSN